MQSISRPGPLGRRNGIGRKNATSRPQTGQIDDDVVAVGLHVNGFAINGDLQVGKDFEREGHQS